MIIEYHRPQTVDEALRLMARKGITTVPLAGGSALIGSQHLSDQPVEAVDLQALGLNKYEKQGNRLVLGAALTLHNLLDIPDLSPAIQEAVLHEAAYNLRQVATVAGTLVAADGRSPFTTALLALDAVLEWMSLPDSSSLAQTEQINLGDLLPLRLERLRGRLITKVTLPLNVCLAYHSVARTPADQPIVSAAVASWPSGRTRVTLGGYGPAPVLALDGPEPGGVEAAVRNAYVQAGDEWASAEYRQETAVTLALRGLQSVQQGIGDKG